MLQRYVGRGWRSLTYRPADQLGRAFFRITPGRTSSFRIQAVGTTSGVAHIRVTAARRGARAVFHPGAAAVFHRGTAAVFHPGVAVVAEAARYRGAPYRYGGAGPRGFDCSGFTLYVYRKFGRALPHSATAQARLGVGVTQGAALPGDLVLFGGGSRYYHAAIYAGSGYMWDASTYGRPVALRRIFSPRFVVRRVI